MLNKNILIITYYWPPSGGPAVQRWLDFANRLAKDNYNVFVLTVSEQTATYTSYDTTLLNQIDPRIQIHYADAIDYFAFYKKFIGKGTVPGNALADDTNPNFIKKISRFIRGNFFIPDPRIGWKKQAVKVAQKIIIDEGIDVFITAGPPQSTHLIGLGLKAKKTNIKWIADFHDYWTNVFYLKKFYRTAIAQKIDLYLEKKVIENADQILVHTDYNKNYLKNRTKKHLNIEVVRIGYDEQKFNNATKQRNEIFTITYAGTLPDYYHPESFFEALVQLKKEHPSLKLITRFIGIISDTIQSMVSQYQLEDWIVFEGYKPHLESIEAIMQSDLLLLINPRLEQDEAIVPGKIFEYIATANPILSISSKGSENEMILKETHTGANYDWNDIQGIKNYIYNCIMHPTKNKVAKNNSYSRAEQYQKLIQIL
jgi:glycosyltransferase involved in cell wall biosynthesis